MGKGYINTKKIPCQYCNKQLYVGWKHEKHESKCIHNPIHKRKCKLEECNNFVKTKKHQYCSIYCSNKIAKGSTAAVSSYKTICFRHHKKECVECGETNIVAVHHYDHNHDNNSPENLVPLCPTHHQYMHSRYRHLIEDKVKKYINRWRKERCIAQSG